MRRLLVVLAFCVTWALGVSMPIRAAWDWLDMMGPLPVQQTAVAGIGSEGSLYKMAKQGNWWVRVSAILRLGELATPGAARVLYRLYKEWPADLVEDSPPDVTFFSLAVLGKMKSAASCSYLKAALEQLASRVPVPRVADGRDRWLGALKGLSYFPSTANVEWCQRIVADSRFGAIVREWACECAIEMTLALKGLPTLADRARTLQSGLQAGVGMPYASESAIRRRSIERRLVAYATVDGKVEELVAAWASAAKDASLRATYTGRAQLARLSRVNPRTTNPASRLGCF